jgi:hypothetical protein
MRVIRHMLIMGLAACMVLYLVNPTAGILELLPDNLPLVGNLDEAGATLILLQILAYYGIRLPFSERRLPPPSS